jgi:hypothetical protein
MQLRKLTYRSRIEFGYHAGRTVEQILQHRTGKQYMTWLYFNASHISFSDELMQDLGITHELIKPGKDPDKFLECYYKPSEWHVSSAFSRITGMDPNKYKRA